ncbi:MAG: fimbrillin family protein [Bacteroidaceae bacterium]|nr:fimbrillin family protein [Bacteroidaceae bacterium]
MKHFLNCLPLLLLASCTSELTDMVDDVTPSRGDVGDVIISCEPFEWDDDTRTMITATNSKLEFAWTDRDAIGVFPVKPTTNSQAKQVLRVIDGVDAHFAAFDGAGWDLKDGNTYAAYSPYNGKLTSDVPYTAVPIDMTGQDGTLETIGRKYDIMYAPSTDKVETIGGEERQVVFAFKHKVAILALNLTVPVEATWKNVTISSATGKDVWITSATMNVSTGAIQSVAKSPSISLDLKNVKTTADNMVITVYASVLPVSGTGTVYISATTDGGEKYVASFLTKSFGAGKAYRSYTGTLVKKFESSGMKDGHAYVDFGFPSGTKWATMNLGASTPTAVGDYYAWGETKPQTDNAYSWESYKWKGEKIYNDAVNSYCCGVTKYSVSDEYGVIDNLTALEADDDAVIQNWGGAWRMPNREEAQELVDSCYAVYTLDYNDTGIPGYIVFKAKSKSYAGRLVGKGSTPSTAYSLADPHLFLPVTGWMQEGKPDIADDATLWTSALGIDGNMLQCDCGKEIYFTPGSFGYGGVFRWNGLNIRGVCK